MQIAQRFSKPSPVNRVLIIQLGDIGDVVWSLPALGAIRDAYPAAILAVLVREGNGSLLTAESRLPIVFEVRKGQGGFWGRFRESIILVRDLRRERFDLVFDFRGDARGGYTAFATGAPLRAALYLPELSGVRNRLFTHLAAPFGEAMNVGAADSSLFLLRAFGIEARTAVPELHCSSEVLLKAQKILAGEGIVSAPERGEDRPAAGRTGRWVTVNPYSRWPYKEWAPEKWARIIDWLRQEFGIASVIIGSPAEKGRAEELCRSCAGTVYNLAGKTTLAELAGLLTLSRLHIGVDSAAPHIAAAVGTPTVTLYGPSDWRYWSPPGKRNRVVVSDRECVPCHQKGCEGSGTSRCLDALDVAAVQSAVREALSS